MAVPIGKQLTYFYRPHREGTYMYHCHFEDVEHVQMGMTGHRLRPPAAGRHRRSAAFTKFAYNDGDGSTGYDRQFAILLNELWTSFHDGDRDIQETIADRLRPAVVHAQRPRATRRPSLPNDDPSSDDAAASPRRTRTTTTRSTTASRTRR